MVRSERKWCQSNLHQPEEQVQNLDLNPEEATLETVSIHGNTVLSPPQLGITKLYDQGIGFDNN
jgi:hypothetical protein